MKTVQQLRLTDPESGKTIVGRYDKEKESFYTQNRSHDKALTVDEYLVMLNKTIEGAKERGHEIELTDVGVNEPWNNK